MPKISALGGMSSRGFGEFLQQSSAAYIEDYFSTYLYTGTGADLQIVNGINLGGEANAAAFTVPGTYTWTCPAGVTSVSVVCIGGGGSSPYGGAAGGLGYKNNISVTPGQTYTVVVGAGVARNTNGVFSSTSAGDSYFISDTIVKGGGAKYLGGSSFAGGTYTGDGGGNGGNVWTSASGFGSGAGAGGYSGNGGQGVGSTPAKGGNAGAGGGGGSGGIGVTSTSFYMGAGGGGTGIYGSGSSGFAGPSGTISTVPATGGGGGSGGETGASVNASYSDGGKYGGGGGSGGGSGSGFNGAGAGGAVRIVWPGTTRQFPSTNVSYTANTSDGGLVWLKSRSITADHALYDTARGATFDLASNTTAAQTTQSTGLTSFTSSGFTIGSLAKINTSASTNVSWTFKKQPKFFDVVTYTGTGVATTISHNLGSVPGMIIVKQLNTARSWQVYHRSIGSGAYIILNSTSAQLSSATRWNNTNPTSTVFSVGADTTVNELNGTYVAYLFAHNAGGFGADGAQNVISCGSFTTSNGFVNLDFEPQFFLYKNSTDISDWIIADNMRGWNTSDGSSTNGFGLNANTNGGEYSWYLPSPSATGVTPFVAGTYIYMAIRRGPMRTPTSGTSVFSPITANAVAGTAQTTNFVIDSQWKAKRAGDTLNTSVDDRLRGVSTTTTASGKYLITSVTAAEAGTNATTRAWDNTGFQIPSYYASASDIFWNFARAPGFFDVVCYTGTGVARTVNHNLGVTPELMIVKHRGDTKAWAVYHNALGNTKFIFLNSNDIAYVDSTFWNNTSPTSSVFTVGTVSNVNGTAGTPAGAHIAYLFATCPGVSKVGSYTGTGATQTISCGFTGGARYVLIKRTDSIGDWWVWDTARGMIAGTDPRLAYNSTTAETNANWVYTTTGGFQIVTSDATVNASGGTYIYLAIA